MKILHIITSLSPSFGGPVTVIQKLTEVLANKGVDVSIFSIAKNEEKIIYPKGIKVKIFPPDYLAKFWAGHSFIFKDKLRKEINNFDLIHIHGSWHYPCFVASKIARETKKPYIITLHGTLKPWSLNSKYFKKKIYILLFLKQILNRASVLHIITNQEAENIRNLGINTGLKLIPNGINIEEFKNLSFYQGLEMSYPILKEKKVILFLGRIHLVKGLDILAKAFGKIAKSRNDICLFIAGPDENGYQAEIESILKKEGVLNKTIFAGILTGKEKLVVLNRANFCVIPSYSEVRSIVALEAMICRLPIIITSQCGFPEVEKAEAGIIIEPETNQLVKAISRLLDDSDLCQKMGRNGERLVREKYTWEKIGEQMIQLYKRVLNDSNINNKIRK